MESNRTDAQRVLDRSAIIVLAMGLIGIAMVVLIGVTRFSGLRPLSIIYFIRGVLVPLLYVIMAKPIGRHRYGAMLTCGVVASMSLATIMLNLPLVLKYSYVSAIYVITVLTHVGVLAAAIMARPAMTAFPNRSAVQSALVRASIASYISGTLMGILSLLIISATFLLFARSGNLRRNSGEQIAVLLAAIAILICWAAAVELFRNAPRTRRGARPTRLTLAAALFCLATTLFVIDFALGGIWSFSSLRGYEGILLPIIIKAVFVWLLIELIHARRQCEDPASFGFEPIFATPVLLRSDHASPS